MLDAVLLQTALLTIALELPLFWLWGYRSSRELGTFAGANLLSNLLLNEALPAYTSVGSYRLALTLGEMLVVLLEFALMRYVVKENEVRLFKAICCTNAFSLAVGLLLLW